MEVKVPNEQKAAFVFEDSANATPYFGGKVCGARTPSEDDVLSKAEGRSDPGFKSGEMQMCHQSSSEKHSGHFAKTEYQNLNYFFLFLCADSVLSTAKEKASVLRDFQNKYYFFFPRVWPNAH